MSSNDCISRSSKSLLHHQVKFVESFIKSKHHGALAIWQVGSGKTLLSVAASKCYLDKYPDGKVIVITPASLLAGFEAELRAYERKAARKYKFYTYASFYRNPCNCKDALIIVDEAQSLKSPDSASFKSVLKCSMAAAKILLLSATPIINKLYDIEPLMAIMHQHPVISETAFKRIVKTPALARAYFGCKISFYTADPKTTKAYYPAVKKIHVGLVMNPTTLRTYSNLEKDKTTVALNNIFDIADSADHDLQSFYNGLRRLSSSSTQKIQFIIDFIIQVTRIKKPNKTLNITQQVLDEHTDKFIIFTHFKTHGSDLIIQALKKHNIDYGFIDGSVSKTQRKHVVDDYVSGRVKVILISAAGSTGLNLIETGYVFLVESSWNSSEVIQVEARAIRYMSHIRLPKQKQHVLIIRLALIKPQEAKHFVDLITAKIDYKKQAYRASIDVKMSADAIIKQREIDAFLRNMAKKIPQLESCKAVKKIDDVDAVYKLLESDD